MHATARRWPRRADLLVWAAAALVLVMALHTMDRDVVRAALPGGCGRGRHVAAAQEWRNARALGEAGIQTNPRNAKMWCGAGMRACWA